MNNKLVKVDEFKFGSLVMPVYRRGDDFFVTRQQIGEALEYDDPNRNIAKLHERHKERLDKYSTLVKVTTVDGKRRDVFLYNAKGVYEICRWSKQPKADAFYDAVYDLLESLRKQETQRQINRATGKEARSNIVRAIAEEIHGPNKKYAYKNYTDMAYRAMYDRSAKQLKQDKNLGEHDNLRDTLSPAELKCLEALEGVQAAMVRAHYKYDDVKRSLAIFVPRLLPSV